MTTEIKLQKMANRVQDFLDNHIFPKWICEGVFENNNGFVEEFDLKTAKPALQSFRRLRVQGRQTWVFATAATAGYAPKKNLQCAKYGWQAITTQFAHANGGFIHSVDVNGQPLNEERFLYEQAFVLLGAAGLYGATKDIQYLIEAQKLYTWISNNMKAEEGFYTSYGNSGEPRQQNPHMHLFEALMELYVVSKEKYWLNEATKIYELYQKYFYDAQYKLLREFFESDWKTYNPVKGDNIEPGHNYEWVWLLNHYRKLTDIDDKTKNDLYAFALKTTNELGLGYDECDPNGKIIRKTSRLWVQTEELKANLAQYEVTHNDIFIERAEQCLNNIFAYYLRDNGLWGDQLDDKLNELSAITPASTFYHIYLAFAEVTRIAKIN